jgi:hypothetical protein
MKNYKTYRDKHEKFKKSKIGETQFMAIKDYDFGIYKMDPSVDVLNKFKRK